LSRHTQDAITELEAEAAYELFRTRGTETRTVLIPSNPSSLTITNIANNGSGLARVTYTGTANPTLATGNIVAIGGGTPYDGSWVITVIDSQDIDLQGSTFTTAATS